MGAYQKRAHPRVSGENDFIGGRVASSSGSSPRERGKPYRHVHFLVWGRLIPA